MEIETVLKQDDYKSMFNQLISLFRIMPFQMKVELKNLFDTELDINSEFNNIKTNNFEHNFDAFSILKNIESNIYEFETNKTLKTKIIEAEAPNQSPVEMFGIWKNEDITLKKLRKKAWRKIKL